MVPALVVVGVILALAYMAGGVGPATMPGLPGVNKPPVAGNAGPISPAMTGGSPLINQQNQIRIATNGDPVVTQSGVNFDRRTRTDGMFGTRYDFGDGGWKDNNLPSAAGNRPLPERKL